MRIAITIDGVEVFSTETPPETAAEATWSEAALPEGFAPPSSVLRAAAALGAENAGPPPAELAAELEVAGTEVAELSDASTLGGYREIVPVALDGGKAPAGKSRAKASARKKTSKK